jgi:hypothetical protein
MPATYTGFCRYDETVRSMDSLRVLCVSRGEFSGEQGEHAGVAV